MERTLTWALATTLAGSLALNAYLFHAEPDEGRAADDAATTTADPSLATDDERPRR